MRTLSLLEPDVPDGFQYRDDVITPAEERTLLQQLTTVTFTDFEMHGVVAKRRVAFFGADYSDSAPASEMPKFLDFLRVRMAEWAGVATEDFSMLLINAYPPGAPIGWHRDAPQYDVIAGVSLLSTCRMKFRPYLAPHRPATRPRTATHQLTLFPRSGYVMAGVARQQYEHSIPPVKALRYSITVRTRRSP